MSTNRITYTVAKKPRQFWGCISGAGGPQARLTRPPSLQERCVAALARVERTDFLSPLCIGEVVHASAEITYTSKHSVEVQVNVTSENILTGKPCADRGLAVRRAGPNTARDGLLSFHLRPRAVGGSGAQAG